MKKDHQRNNKARNHLLIIHVWPLGEGLPSCCLTVHEGAVDWPGVVLRLSSRQQVGQAVIDCRSNGQTWHMLVNPLQLQNQIAADCLQGVVWQTQAYRGPLWTSNTMMQSRFIVHSHIWFVLC